MAKLSESLHGLADQLKQQGPSRVQWLNSFELDGQVVGMTDDALLLGLPGMLLEVPTNGIVAIHVLPETDGGRESARVRVSNTTNVTAQVSVEPRLASDFTTGRSFLRAFRTDMADAPLGVACFDCTDCWWPHSRLTAPNTGATGASP